MELGSYTEFSASLQRRGAAARLPLQATFEVTHRCPLGCQHCYNNLPVGDRAARAGELSADEHKRLLDELAALGGLWLLYTGGEIFARPDFLDIYTYARGKGFVITLFTNATMITPAIADHLARHRPFAIEVTLYGHTRATYERLTGVAGSFDRCLRGIELLRARGLPLTLKTVALTVNLHELEAMKRFAGELGLPFKLDAMMSPRIDCSQSPLAVRLQPEECVALDVQDEERMAAWRQFADRFVGPQRPRLDEQALYQCGGGITSFAVDPRGGMSICVLSQNEKYDLRAGPLAEGWAHFLRRVRERRATRVSKCTTCALKSLCGMCPANGELENRDPEAPVEFLCEVAHLRAYALGLEVPAHGDCSCCPGGASHPRLMASVARLGGVDRRTTNVRRAAALSVAAQTTGCGDGCTSCHSR